MEKNLGFKKYRILPKQSSWHGRTEIWTFSGESKKRIGHPAPFPIELAKRCIKLFSFVGDTVLDPFMGSGTTLVAAYLHSRKGIGVDIDNKYCELAVKRLQTEAKINHGVLVFAT